MEEERGKVLEGNQGTSGGEELSDLGAPPWQENVSVSPFKT